MANTNTSRAPQPASPGSPPTAQLPLDLSLRAVPVTPAYADRCAAILGTLVRPGVVLLPRRRAA